MTDQSKEDKFDELLNAPVDPGELTNIERTLRDAIIELARMMVTHVDPRNVQTVIDRLLELDADTTEE